jgi:hypothetical protein
MPDSEQSAVFDFSAFSGATFELASAIGARELVSLKSTLDPQEFIDLVIAIGSEVESPACEGELQCEAS